jgi:hypothetical protein
LQDYKSKALRRPSKIIRGHPSFSHPKHRDQLLCTISNRLDELVHGNLHFYKSKRENKIDLRKMVKSLSKDQDYKRNVQSTNVVKFISKGDLIGVEKVRHLNELTRRANYKKIRFLKCVQLWKKWFSEVG